MAPLEQEGPPVEELATRFLSPFFFKGQACETAELLLGLDLGGRQVWKRAEPHDFYRQELLENVSDFLFPKEPDGGCQFLEVPRELLQSWFKSSGIPMSTGKGEALFSAVVCERIEVFLSPYGAGVLSITLKPVPERGAGAFSIGHVKDFNYHGAQLRKRITPRFTIPYPEAKYAEGMAPPPAADADIRVRLGVTGCVFSLGELRDFLLERIPSWRKVQDQFSIYSVVRFGRDVSFDSTDVIHGLSAALAGLSQIEERLHAGAPRGEIEVPNRILNVKHWAAVSFLGAAHLIAHQGVPFDGQRFQNVRDKYFIPYLTALLQRLATQRIRRDAQKMVVAGDSSVSARSLMDLRFETMRFAACSNFTEVSSREAINRYYDLSREGLRVAVSLAVAKEAIVDLDAAAAATWGHAMTEKLNQSVDTVADVQTKVEWLEVFFVSFYAAELSELIGNLWGFNHTYSALAVPFWMIFGLAMAAWGLRPWHRKPISWRALVAVVVFVVLWIVGGSLSRNPETFPPSHGQLPAEHTSSEQRLL